MEELNLSARKVPASALVRTPTKKSGGRGRLIFNGIFDTLYISFGNEGSWGGKEEKQDKKSRKYSKSSINELTSRNLFLFGVPQGFNPPEKLGKLRHTIDLILYVKENKKLVG